MTNYFLKCEEKVLHANTWNSMIARKLTLLEVPQNLVFRPYQMCKCITSIIS